MEESTKNVFYSIFYFSYSLIKTKSQRKIIFNIAKQNIFELLWKSHCICKSQYNRTTETEIYRSMWNIIFNDRLQKEVLNTGSYLLFHITYQLGPWNRYMDQIYNDNTFLLQIFSGIYFASGVLLGFCGYLFFFNSVFWKKMLVFIFETFKFLRNFLWSNQSTCKQKQTSKNVNV